MKLVNLVDHSSIWLTTENNAKGIFPNIPYGNYDVEISAVGYLSTHKNYRFSTPYARRKSILC